MLATAPTPTATATIWALPTLDAHFVQAIDDIAILGSGVLMFAGGTLLAIDLARPSRPVIWDDDSMPAPHLGAAIARDVCAAPALRALALAVDDLRGRLTQWGWAGVAPACSVVTDGTGVALVAGEGGDWTLARIVCDAFVVRPFEDATTAFVEAMGAVCCALSTASTRLN